MTTADTTPAAPTTTAPKGRRWFLRAPALIVAALLFAAVGYAVSFGGCDTDSKFCYLGLVGTRSEVVVAWLDEFEVYTQTAPAQ
ncbi:hypothetical protein ACFWC6_32740 [Micromonospora chalcea]